MIYRELSLRYDYSMFVHVYNLFWSITCTLSGLNHNLVQSHVVVSPVCYCCIIGHAGRCVGPPPFMLDFTRLLSGRINTSPCKCLIYSSIARLYPYSDFLRSIEHDKYHSGTSQNTLIVTNRLSPQRITTQHTAKITLTIS